jgi:WS/DGAT/MGAT family acyltransferase
MATRSMQRQHEPMSKVDTAWLRMETPTNLMMITGVLMLAEPIDLGRFKRTLAERWLSYRRFRQKAVDGAAGAMWETDADFDLDWHVRITALPGQAGQAELQHLVSQLASTPLDHSKPLWQFHVVERYKGGSAVIARIHHCYADGLALVQVMLTLTDTENRPEVRAALAETWLDKDRGSVLERLLAPTRAGLERAIHFGEQVYARGKDLVQDPAMVAQVVHEASAIAREFAHAVTLPDDPPTAFKGPLGVTKRVAWMDPLSLEEVKTVGRSLGCTVNDVLLAACTGALRSYLCDLDEAVDGLTIRATVPVNLRPLEHARKLGNHFGLVFLDLPVGEPNPIRRLERISASMAEIKRSRQAIMTFGVLGALGMGPQVLQRPALDLFSKKATAVVTNVPGPAQPLYLAGCRISEQMFWVPQSGTIGMGISILSYDGHVYFGLIVDAKLVPRPDEIIRRFRPEFEKLLLITLMEDWAGPITAADAAATLERYTGDDGVSPVEGHITHGEVEPPEAGAPTSPSRQRKSRPAKGRPNGAAGAVVMREEIPRPAQRPKAAPSPGIREPAAQPAVGKRRRGAPIKPADGKRRGEGKPARDQRVAARPSTQKSAGKSGRRPKQAGARADGFAAALAAFRAGDED